MQRLARASISLSQTPSISRSQFIRNLMASSSPSSDLSVRSTSDAVVSCEWLHSNLARVKVLDGTYFLGIEGRNAKEEFKAKRIPTAQFFDIDAIADKSTSLPHMLPTKQTFEEAMTNFGIKPEDRVVIYDAKGMFSAARVWWTFQVFGHKNVSVLDGGLPAYISNASYEIDTNPSPPSPTPSATPYRCTVSDADAASAVCSYDQMLKNLSSPAFQVVDARSADRFFGRAPEPRPGIPSGHMPNALSVPFTTLLNAQKANTFLSPEELKAVFSKAGLDLSKPMTTTCGSGATAAVLSLGLHLCGVPLNQCGLYDGAWLDWASRPGSPIEPTPRS